MYASAVEGLAPYHWLGQPPHLASGVRPRRAQHINVNGPDVPATTDFFVEVLGFRLSDQIVGPDGAPLMNFLRCNADHHTLAVGLGAPGILHVAFEVDSVLDLVRLGDLLDRRPVRQFTMNDPRVASIWGPTADLGALFAAAIPLAPAG